MFFLYLIILFVTVVYSAYYYFTRTFNYWQSRNIPGPRPIPFFGNYKNFILRKETFGTINKQIYHDYPNEKVVGFYRMTRRSLLIRDLDVIKNILIKDFDYFEDRGVDFNIESLGANIFHANSEIWRPLRNRLTPLFTSGKLKNMIALINEKSDIFLNYINNIVETQNNTEMHSLFKMFTTSSFGACAFGLDIDTNDGPMLSKLNMIDNAFKRRVSQDLDLLHPGVLKIFNMPYFQKEINNFFLQLIKDMIVMRNGVSSQRNDFIDLMMELKNEGVIFKEKKDGAPYNTNESIEITNEIIASQALIFYLGGTETTSSTMAFMMYELAMNPEIQEKLIAEVDEVLARHNGKITYQTISDLQYMSKVLQETLRKYPVAEVFRRAKTDYKIPGTNITIEKDITIMVPVLAINNDEKYYPNPSKFDPERFSSENENNRHSCAYIPFGTGPRHCIGKLFAKYQIFLCLIRFLSNFYVKRAENTTAHISFDPQRIVNTTKGGLYLNILKRKKAQ